MDTDEILYLKNRWGEINKTIKTLSVEKSLVRKRIRELGGTLTGRGIGRPATESNEKHDHIIALFKEGKTLQEIADMYGFSRQRANYILKKNGISGNDGGHSVKEKQKHCLVDGCLIGRPYPLGYCQKHYAKFKRYGDPLKLTKHDHEEICSVEGCDRPYKSNGYCNTHRMRLYLKGDVGEAEIAPVGKHKNRGTYCKLSDDQISEIRALYVRGKPGEASEFSATGLAKKYGVSSTLISNIVNNKI